MIEMFSSSWASYKSTVITKKGLYLQFSERTSHYDVYASDGNFLWTYTLLKDGGADVIDFETNYKALANQKVGTGDSFPFAIPTHRTKHDGPVPTAPAISFPCPKGADTEVKFKMTQEFFTNGGCLLIKNAQFGDWVYAEVEDSDGVIPAPYRPALCEAWPVVAKYIIRENIEFLGQEYTIHKLDTKPLAAKISTNLYLCIHYVAVNSGLDRELLINYYLNKKL